jgi:exopolysaccharide production protein ExoQ
LAQIARAPASDPVYPFASIERLCCTLALAALLFLQFSQTIAAAAFMGFVCLVALLRPGSAYQAIVASPLLWVYPALALASVAWSVEPDVSIRAGVQIAVSTAAALILAQNLSPRSLITSTMIACLIATGASVISTGPYIATQLINGEPITGIFFSKNSFGFVQSFTILSAFWVARDRSHTLVTRVAALIAVLLAMILLYGSKSAASLAAVIPALGSAWAVFLLRRWRYDWRVLALLVNLVTVLAVFAVLFVLMDDLFSRVIQATGRDATLTGRTVLWDWSEKLMDERPMLGLGLQAFWVQGNPYAEELWRIFLMTRRGGFHFHNLWLEIGVQLGWLGIGIAAVTVAAVSLRVIRWIVRSPDASSCFVFSAVIFILLRTYVEVDLFTQFSFPHVIFVASWVIARKGIMQARSQVHPASPNT